MWASKLHTLTAISTTGAEYIALSMAMHEQLPFLQLLKEVVVHKIDTNLHPTTIHCKAFEDNSGALEMAKVPKMRPRTKHMNNMYHHFRESVQNNEVTLVAVRTDDQLAYLLTKPLPDNLVQCFRDQILNSTTAEQKPLGRECDKCREWLRVTRMKYDMNENTSQKEDVRMINQDRKSHIKKDHCINQGI